MRRQLLLLALLVLVNALLVAFTYLFIPYEQLFPPGTPIPPEVAATPRWLIALIYSSIVLILYGVLGLAGYALARGLHLPGVFRPAAGWTKWLWEPLVIGVGLGIVLVLLDQVFTRLGGAPPLQHPQFPFSIIASGTAGIGEEILFRFFFLGLWAFLANLILRRYNWTPVALWIGNVIAALAFGASHLPALMALAGTNDLSALSPLFLVEIFLLNGILGLVAGRRMIADGLIAAVGIHFWADIVWHIVYPAIMG